MARRAAPFLILLLVFAFAFYLGRTFRFEETDQLHDLELVPAQGQLASWISLRGKKIILFAGFTHCPDVCPASMATLSLTLKSIPEAARQVTAVFVTIDPERDTPEILRAYLEKFKTPLIGFTGTMLEIEKIKSMLNIVSEKTTSRPTGMPYGVNHTYFFYLINEAGKIKKALPGTSDHETLKKSLLDFIAE